MMCCPKRFLVAFMGFFGLLLVVGFRSVFAMVMVNVVNVKNRSFNTSDSIVKNVCIPVIFIVIISRQMMETLKI